MSTTIFNENFLLHTEMAQRLYHGYAAHLPIIDYHNHLPPNEIASNKQFENLTEIWLKGDHYKWRAMRALGVDEKYVTGDATDEEKFKAWAACVPKTLRNPLFHWSHLELKNYFGVDVYLNDDHAAQIYSHCNSLLQTPEFSTQTLLKKFNVEVVGTTDDPCDSLEHHQSIATGNIGIKVVPSFRPDKALQIGNKNAFLNYIKQLEAASNITITSYEKLLEALQNRVDFFHKNGCRVADHGLTQMPVVADFSTYLRSELVTFLTTDSDKPFSQPDTFAGAVLLELCRMYHAKGWVQQFHLGALRNNNSRLQSLIGADVGADSMHDIGHAQNLSKFLDELDSSGQLAKTILYNLNPADNELFATMCGNFNDGKIKGKMQFGSGWWFLDQADGMERQLNALSNMGILSTFIGMTTDSRSFLSFPRHEYFRRLLCNILGNDVEKGLLPNDEQWLGNMVADISYFNAKTYFTFNLE